MKSKCNRELPFSLIRSIFTVCTLIIATFFAVPFLIETSWAKEDSSSRPKRVSLISLIGDPQRYHQDKIVVKGFLDGRFEMNSLYVHHDFLKYGLTKNAIAIGPSAGDITMRDYQEHHGKYVELTGIFNAKSKGHLNHYSARIDEVTRIRVVGELDDGEGSGAGEK